jgi:anti-anti-sigma regulatory factor
MAELTIQRRDMGPVCILALCGELVEDMCVELRCAIMGALEAGACKLLLDFSGVVDADKDGIQDLINAYRTAWNYAAQLKLMHVSPQIKQQLLTTRCVRHTDFFDNEQVAINSFV